jgi:tetratricopeptide (TPR) repeat protein
MNRTQIGVLVACVALFSILYFGAGSKLHKQVQAETSRNINASSGNADTDEIIDKAKKSLSAEQSTEIAALEKTLSETTIDTAKSSILKKISGAWYRLGKLDVSGCFAEKVASIDNTERAWFIAGSTFFTGLQQTKEPNDRQFYADRAAKAFENAISLSPDKVENRVALASVYTENPLADNPMKGILILRELDQKYPNNPLVLVTLAKNAIRTGQYDKAVTRLENAFKVSPSDNNIICLLAQAYEGAGDATKAKIFAQKCK